MRSRLDPVRLGWLAAAVLAGLEALPALPAPWDRARWLSPIRLGLSVLGVAELLFLYRFGGPGFDTYGYWLAGSTVHPYTVLADFGAYHYSPALLPLWGVLAALGWPLAYLAWCGVMSACLAFLGRSWALALLAFPPVASEFYHGNVHLLIAVAVVTGFRYSAAWAFPILTKVTPGVGVLWFAARREWRSFAIALGVTAAVVVVTAAVNPGLWVEWVQHSITLAGVPDRHIFPNAIPVPLVYRLPLAVALTVYAARTDRRWLVPVAVMLAIPVLWFHAFAILAAVPLLWLERGRPTEDTTV